MKDRRTAVIGHRAVGEVAFVGPFGVGKTTAVRALSNIPVASTEVRTSFSFAARRSADAKTTTTVGLDYGEWRSPAGVVALYGTPGQARFRTHRDRMVPASTRLVLWLYGQNEYALDEAQEWLRFLNAGAADGRLTVAVTRLEGDGAPALESYRPVLDSFDRQIALVAADPREAGDVARVVGTALGMPGAVAEATRSGPHDAGRDSHPLKVAVRTRAGGRGHRLIGVTTAASTSHRSRGADPEAGPPVVVRPEQEERSGDRSTPVPEGAGSEDEEKL